MTTYRVHYMTEKSWPKFMLGMQLPDVETLDVTHRFLCEIDAPSLDDVFYRMQGEIWSPNGEARELIQAKGLVHTSMSVGDVIEDPERGYFWMISPRGFFKFAGGAVRSLC